MSGPFAFMQTDNPSTPTNNRGGHGHGHARGGGRGFAGGSVASGSNRSFNPGQYSQDTPIRRPPGSVTGSIDRSVTGSSRMSELRRGGRGGGGSGSGQGARGHGGGRDSPAVSRHNSHSGHQSVYNDDDEDDYEDDDEASNFENSVDGSDLRVNRGGKGKRSAPEVYRYADDEGALSDFDEDNRPRGSRANSVAGTERSGTGRGGGGGGAKRRRLIGGRSVRGGSTGVDGPDGADEVGQPDDGGKGAAKTKPVVKEAGLRRQAAPLGLSGILELEISDVKEFKWMEGTLSQRAKDHQGMLALMYSNTTPVQQERQEALRRANFKHYDIRSVLEHLCGVNAGDKISRMVATVAKTFVMEMVEEALAFQAELKQTGPLRPAHLLEAYKRCAGAKFGGDVDRGFGETQENFFGGV